MTILLAIDDTDTIESRGTGRLARAIATLLENEYPVLGVTRHQLYVHESIPYTSHNSCAVIHIGLCAKDQEMRIFSLARDYMKEDFVEGSDPGIAIANLAAVAPAVITFGQHAKTMVLRQEQARVLAKDHSIRLEGLGGSEDGVIGALAGIGLAATGNDGRYIQKGRIREITGPAPAELLLDAGIELILTTEGVPVTTGIIRVQEGKSVKPCPVSGKTVLFVEERKGTFHAVKRD
jgi:hypothetical protein